MTDWRNSIHTGDCFDVLDELPAESVHAVVTDPPYGLAFMGRDWDDFDPREYQDWCEEWASACLDVLRPGGHLLAFSGNRTHHRLFSGVEDAGFEIRDTLTWHYGSGFPKASDISKTIDKRADAERTEGKRVWRGGERQGGDWSNSDRRGEGTTEKVIYDEPATERGKKWDGWKTGLKPSTEFVVMARKPFDGATVDCVLEHGTGALNVDGCRIGTEQRDNPGQGTADGIDYGTKVYEAETVEGRYPANVVLDPAAAAMLDGIVGELDAGARTPQSSTGRNTSDAPTHNDPDERLETDSGGPSRYFETHEYRDIDEQMARFHYTSKATRAERTLDGRIDNAHPTVKPQDLMEWLVKLVTAEGQTVLDPFVGSGTTCAAAKDLGRTFIGIERKPKWADVARVRVGLTPEDPARVRNDDAQQGLEAFADGGETDE
jgi:site-specific DNA-methyltransferase (adenine-specific)